MAFPVPQWGRGVYRRAAFPVAPARATLPQESPPMVSLVPRNVARPLANSGLMVSPLGWGMWRFGVNEPVAQSRAKIDAALEIGVNLFDTADIYGLDQGAFGGAEAQLGRVFWEDRTLRDRMVLATKGGIVPGVPYDSSADYLMAACDASLARLNVETIDLWQIHRPDHLAHPAEIARAFDKMRTQGKVRAFGVSNFTTAQVAALRAHLDFPLASIQPEFSPFHIDPVADGTLDQALECNMAVLAWSPLGGGRISDPGHDPRAGRVVAALDAIASAQGVSRAAVAYAWVMAHPSGAIPLIGSQNPARIREAADAFAISLTREDWYAILVAARGAPMP
jgi:predicted oxidoreductase